MNDPREGAIPRREYRNGESLSIIGFGGILLLGQSAGESSQAVGEAFDRGINYFDVAPSYGDGEAEERLGPALKPYRERVFLACKTMSRDAAGARREMETSLARLRTDHVDLYQFHAVTTMDDVAGIFAPDGALEAVVRARTQGLLRYIGFSAHSEEAALAMLERFPFDSILFPVNIVCSEIGTFGPRVMEAARKKGTARLALKAMAYSPREPAETHPWPKCWYRPIDDPDFARLALRFTLSEDITSALPPGEIPLFRMAMEFAAAFSPLDDAERRDLSARIKDVRPLFPLRDA